MLNKLNILWILLTVFGTASSLTASEMTLQLANISEDGRLSFCELAIKYGLNCTRYNVTTKDGYILGLFHIPGNKDKPIYIQHGIVDSPDTFLIRTNKSIIAFLAQKGYDIWLGNMRGNKYARAHTTLKPEGSKFWNFSFHEIAIYDMTALIDFILEKTGQKQVRVIGHSQGTTLFFTLGVMRPEYNAKIKVLICLAPIVYLQNAEPLFPLAIPAGGPAFMTILGALGAGELFGNTSQLTAMVRVVCSQKYIGYAICAEGFAFLLFGRDSEQVEEEFWPTVIGHYPGGSSIKNGVHLLQLASRKEFAQYDFGLPKNLQVYKRPTPPVYDLSKVTMNVVLLVGTSDKVTNMKDIEVLRSQLPNVVGYHIIDRKEWNHMDFVWAKDMDVYLFGHLFDNLEKYSD